MVQDNYQGHYAGLASRVLAFAVDLLVVAVSVFAIGWLVSTTLSLFGINVGQCPPLGTDRSVLGWICRISAASLVVIAFGFAPVYVLLMWSLSGQTIGKGLLGVRIVRLNGQPMSLWTGIKRLFGYVVTLLTLGLGFLWLLLDDRRQALHDKIAGTCVVYSWEARPDENFLRRLQARFSRRQGNTPTLRTPTQAEMRGRSYALAMLPLDDLKVGFRVWDMLYAWNEEDPGRVIRAALVAKDTSGQLLVQEPKYQRPGGASQDGPELAGVVQVPMRELGERVTSLLPDGSAAMIAILEEGWAAQLSDIRGVGEAMVAPLPIDGEESGPAPVGAAGQVSQGQEALVEEHA